jgi:hypothetical protein
MSSALSSTTPECRRDATRRTRTGPRGNFTTHQDAVWWVTTTTTTVGYEMGIVTTWEGRFVAAGLLLVGSP